MDIMVFPRKGHTVCEVVSPLKPFEAMATGKAVVASDVRALAEIVRHNETGLLHRKDDVDSLREQLEAYLSQPNLRARLARQGQDWVTQQRSWSAISDKVGAALSLVYTTGKPIVFVGVGQTYTDIRNLNVDHCVKALLRS